MPRQNKLRHPIKLVREATGFSQEQFARLVGHSKDTIQAIEIGRHKPSRLLAEKIFIQTGAIPETLLNGRGRPLDIEGEPYTSDSFARWTSIINRPNTRLPEREKGTIQYLTWMVRTVQHAALRAGKLFAVQYQLDRRIAEIVREFRLKENINGLLSERPYTQFAWTPMFVWKPGEPSRLMRHYVVRGEGFEQQEIYGFSPAYRKQRAAIEAAMKTHLTTKPIGRFTDRRANAASKIPNRRKIRSHSQRRTKRQKRSDR
jgi:DNA-binding XRE family transcriptional regulator